MSQQGLKNRSLRVPGGYTLVEVLAALGALQLKISRISGSTECVVEAPEGYSFNGEHLVVESGSEDQVRLCSDIFRRRLARYPDRCSCGWDAPLQI